MSPYIAVQKPFKNPRHLQAPLKWARMHEKWTAQQSSQAMFTGESTFTVRTIKNRLRVWRKPGQIWEQQYLVPKVKSGFQSVSVKAGFSKQERTSLVGIVGNFNQHTYHSIIDAYILPFKDIVHGNNALSTLHEDDCRPHREKSSNTYPYSASVNGMQWPAQSPDLNPIDNMWGIAKQKLRKRIVMPSNPNKQFMIISEIWNSMPDEYFHDLVASMPASVRIMKENSGGLTKY